MDPLADAPLNVGWSPYHYVWNSPLIFIDPDGRHGEWIDNGDGTWTAEAGDHAGTLAEDAGITYDQANAIIQAQYGDNRTENGVEYSNVDPGDVVDVDGQFDAWHADFVANHATTILDQPNSNAAEAMMEIFSPDIVGTILMMAQGTGGTKSPKGFNPKFLDKSVRSNFNRFVKKVPANSKSSANYRQLDDGNYMFEATSPGKVPGSKAVYQKWVNPAGETFKMTKTTYDPAGKIIHVKPKF